MVILEKNEVPVFAAYDVIVLGGGIAGVSAALAARRSGNSVLLIEKSVMLGGLATGGHVNKYLPLCDGEGKKVCAGISEELLLDAAGCGYNTLPPEWRSGQLTGETRQRYMSEFSPYDFAILLDEKLERCGVELLFDTVFSKPVMNGTRCEAVIVENKCGRSAYRAKAFVDATGDADLMRAAGVACIAQDNWLTSWSYVTSGKHLAQGAREESVARGVPLYELGATDAGIGGEAYPKYDGIDPIHRTRFLIDGRRLTKERILQLGEADASVVALPCIPQLRTTRRISGEYEIGQQDINRRNERSIGCAPDWRRRGEVYEVPFEALYSNRADNILTAGRCISSSRESWEVTRVIPACAVTGQAAGVAAGILAKRGCAAKEIDIANLQSLLEHEGVLLHYR